MTAVDFRSKKLNVKVFAGRTVNTTRVKSTAFGAIMTNKKVARVLDKRKEKAVFFNALKKEGSVGVTRNKLRKVLGDVESSGQFSSKEMRTLGRELIGGVASKRIIRERKSEISEKPKVDMNKVMQEIRDKRKLSLNNLPADAQKNNNPVSDEPRNLNFGTSEKNLRNAEQLLTKADNYDEEAIQYRPASVMGYIANCKENDKNKVQDMLARIQAKSEAREDKKSSLTQKYSETLNQKNTEQSQNKDAELQTEGKNATRYNETENTKKDDREKNISQTIKDGQEKIQEMSLAGQEGSPDYQKLIALLIKNQDGGDVWKSAEEMDIASIESFLKEYAKKTEKFAADLGSASEPKDANAEQIQVENEKTDLAA